MRQPGAATSCWLLATLLAALHAATGQLSPSASTLRGRVIVLYKDLKINFPCREVYLRNESDVTTVNVTSDAPPRAVFRLEGSYAAALRSGQRVAVTGYRIGGLGDGTERVRLTSMEVLEQPDYARGISAGGGAAGDGGATASGMRRRVQQAGALPTLQLPLPMPEVSTLVLPISFAGCPNMHGGTHEDPWWTQQDVDAIFFGTGAANDEWASVGGLYNSCSHAQASLTRSNSRVMPIIQLPCSGFSSYGTYFSSTTCDFPDFVGWQEAAADAARAAGVDTSAFLFQHVILPLGTACEWVGIGYIGCDRSSFDCASWVQGDTLLGPTRGSEQSAQAAFHEMGHNQFLDHSAALNPDGSVHVYADTSDAMGYCCADRCYNTPHSWQLGWLAPQVLDAGSLGPGDTRSVTIVAQSRSKNSGLQIDANTWLNGQNNTVLYVSLRLPENGDSALGLPYIRHVSVHNFTSRDNFTPQLSCLLAMLDEGEALTEGSSGLVIRVTDISPQAGAATVSVCRKAAGGLETQQTCKAGQDGDCDGLVGGADADCWAHVARPPSPHPPPPIPPLRSTLLTPGPAPNPALTVPANATKQCLLGHAFCTDVAKAAAQAKPAANFFVSRSPLAGQCRYWLARPTCTGSLVPCGCAPASTVQGSAVKPPPSKQTAIVKPTPQQRCALGHGGCAARARGSICQYWASAGGKQPTCTGSRMPCSCSSATAVRTRTG